MSNSKTYTHLSQSDIALQIESLVQAIERNDTPAFRITSKRSGCEQVEQTRLSRYFTNIQQMFNLFDDRLPYDNSEHLQAFWEACQDIKLERRPNGPVCWNERDGILGSSPPHECTDRTNSRVDSSAKVSA